MNNGNDKSLESWIWNAACSIRGAQEAPKFKDFILPLVFTKRLCDVFDDELNRIAQEVGSRAKAFKLVEKDRKLVRFYLPLKPQDADEPVWSVIRKLTGKIGESLTTFLHDIAKVDPALVGIIDRMDFNATTHGQRDIDDVGQREHARAQRVDVAARPVAIVAIRRRRDLGQCQVVAREARVKRAHRGVRLQEQSGRGQKCGGGRDLDANQPAPRAEAARAALIAADFAAPAKCAPPMRAAIALPHRRMK